ncbi:MAG: hypothetical protein AUH84_05180 [Thaumarchaeota archaeon 13_1_40CM_4_38_7]|nr:MAG: hypothetical protein AUH84_05180 [Thaumarchaeota archaeon 13_1_40CM_4_38_7]OLC93818.1 MAG: hypothetical protein AUI92_02095 [Thaumarchaeota archaeon 13_1_40CM_3_38_6]
MEEGKFHGSDAKKELDILLSRLNALEAASTDRSEKSALGVLKVLVENQKHFIDEFEHLKKALDLITLQLFKLERDKNS